MIPLHPQPSPGRPDEIRWILPPGTLPFTGPAAGVPAALTALLADGTLAGVRLDPAAVVTALAPGRSWAAEGARVRSAVQTAAGQPRAWVPAAPEPGGTAVPGPDDESLRVAAEALLRGPVGEFARSHGGSIDLVGVRDGVVSVRLTGACDGCPAASATLRGRLEGELRRRHPGLREVVAQPAAGGVRQRALALLTSRPASSRAVPNHSAGTSTGPRRLARMKPQ